LFIDEYEAIRLRDVELVTMKQGASIMWVSAPTFNRIVMSARRKIANAIVYWKWIRIYTKDEKIGTPHNQF